MSEPLRETGPRALVVAAFLSLAIEGCHADNDRLVAVQVISPKSPLVSVASHWVGAGKVLRPSLQGGSFTVSIARGQRPVPFIDVNENGRLDLGFEPTAPCEGTEPWSCRMRAVRLIVHRIQRALEDSTLVFGEAYDPISFAPDGNARLCLAGEKDCAGERIRPPYVGAPPTLMLKLCELTGKDDPSKRYDVEVRSAGGVMLAASVTQPPSMGLRAKLERHGNQFWVVGTTELVIHRVLVWIAPMVDQETKKMHWSSEAEPRLVAADRKRLRAEVPRDRLAECPDCVIGLQVVSEQTVGAVTMLSEGASVMSPGDVR